MYEGSTALVESFKRIIVRVEFECFVVVRSSVKFLRRRSVAFWEPFASVSVVCPPIVTFDAILTFSL